MPESASPAARFKAFREHSGFSQEALAAQLKLSSPCIWDIESVEGELAACYSPTQVSDFATVLGVRPVDFFGWAGSGAPVSALDLVGLIHQECDRRGVSLEQFEDAVGWRLSTCLDPPSRLLEDITVDGLQWLCRELRVDWYRVLLGL